MPDWNQILEQFGRVVWKQSLRMLGNEADAADCFQVVMFEAYEISRRKEVKSWPGLLQRLAVMRSLDMLRARYRNATESISESEVPVDDYRSAEGLTSPEYQELAEQLRRELARLPPEQGEAFTLKVIEELSSDEVAQRMQITANHVGVLVHRARKTLRTKMSREEEGR